MLFKRLGGSAVASLGGLVFPPQCAACGESLAAGPTAGGRDEFCPVCLEELDLFAGPTCDRCGASRLITSAACPHCLGKPMRPDRTLALGPYDGLLRHLVLRAKHVTGEQAAWALGRLMADHFADRLAPERPALVACVPMHWTRRAVRQTNPCELMATALGRRLGVAVRPGALRRTRRTARQADLAESDRARNVRGALAPRWGLRLDGATVLLVDDILTTGATCNAAARALRRAGAGRVVAVVAARTL